MASTALVLTTFALSLATNFTSTTVDVPTVTSTLDGTLTTPPATSTYTATLTAPTGSSSPGLTPFPPVGSIPRDFSPAGLARLWDLVGPVQPPPFTTTPVPSTPVILPSPPPLLYPTWYAPQPKDVLPNLTFPDGFLFGVATAAYQVEGAAKEDGKGPTTWDWGPRQPGLVVDGTNGDIVDLEYYLYKEDTARIAALGVKAHSFSLSWARIFPFAVEGSPINQAGLQHYIDVVDYTLSLGIEPVVTLFHWDTPLAMAAYYGGFTSSESINDYINYAVTVFEALNGKVKTWITFNEPQIYCSQIATYPFNISLAPGVNSSTAPYHCAYNILRAHAGAVKAFRQLNITGEIAYKNEGEVGTQWRSNTTDDALAVERNVAFSLGLFSTPVYNTGDWPVIAKETLDADFLPRFSESEIQDIKGSADFYAIDAYASQWVSAPLNGVAACVANSSNPNWPVCATILEYDSGFGWPAGTAADQGSVFIQATPLRLRHELGEIVKRWNPKKIYISEYGFSQAQEGQRTDLAHILDDSDRTDYFMTYLGEALLAIHEDKIPLAGAFSWAMIDNAEWNFGTSTRFGIQYVNYTTLERTFKRSALALSEFYAAHLSQ